MQFMLIYQEASGDFARREDPKQQPAYMEAWMGYIGAQREAGVWVSGSGLLAPHTGTTLRMRGGKRQVQDGPYADAKEHLGGFSIIEVPSLDAALDWAARSPASVNGSTEVRPVMPTVMPA